MDPFLTRDLKHDFILVMCLRIADTAYAHQENVKNPVSFIGKDFFVDSIESDIEDILYTFRKTPDINQIKWMNTVTDGFLKSYTPRNDLGSIDTAGYIDNLFHNQVDHDFLLMLSLRIGCGVFGHEELIRKPVSFIGQNYFINSVKDDIEILFQSFDNPDAQQKAWMQRVLDRYNEKYLISKISGISTS